jgi:transcription elongation factor GreA
MEKSPMTLRSHRASTEELHRLKTVERKKAADALAEARAHGDLSENAEYEAAKDAQGLLEAKVRLLESRLSTAQVIDVSTLSGEKVLFGATVSFEDVDSGESKTVMIVGEDEADADAGLISYVSPLARALIGKSVDDLVQVKLPSGTKEYEIRSVEFKE